MPGSSSSTLSQGRLLDGASLDEHRRLDRLCDDFEAAWTAGRAPAISEALAKAPENLRLVLLAELWAIELHYRRDAQGKPLSDHELRARHPELESLLDALPAEGLTPRSQLTLIAEGPAGAPTPLDGYGRRWRDSRELHIRCPHCSNAVELLADAPVDSVECDSCGSHFSLVGSSDQSSVAQVLQTIGRFDLISRVGVGGFGTVWKARDTELDRVVALKIPRKGQLNRQEVEMFLREARSAAQLRHPNIVPVFEVCHEKETLFIVSEFVRGVSLADWMTAGRRSSREVAELCVPLAEALHAAHAEGIVHRDLKPANVLIDLEGRPRLTDFGLAKREVGEVTMTLDGQVLGTPAYMSPEQARGEGHWTDRRSDIYSLGVILFRLLTGELPFRGSAAMQIHQRITDDPPDPLTLDRTIPRDLATICLKCLEPAPHRRYATAAELAAEFKRFLEGRPIAARPLSRAGRAWRWSRRNPVAAVALLLGGVLAVGGPAAAVSISARNHEIAQRLAERDALVISREADRVRLQKEVKSLRDRLNLLTGGAAPSAPVEPWRVELARSLLAKRFAEYQEQAEAMPNGEAKVAVHFSLARLLQEVDQPEEAALHYEAALRAAPGADKKGVALATDAGLRLILLRLDSHAADAAAETLSEVRGLVDRLKADSGSVQTAIDAYAAERVSVRLANDNDKARRLQEADAIRRGLEQQWPEQAAELPGLVARLLDGAG